MHAYLIDLVSEFSWPLLLVVLVVSLGVLAKSAEWLVDQAARLSARTNIPKVVIGATVVSIGTTIPEASVSVLAALQGSPGLALGNAVGSIICDTGLILGLACIIGPIPLQRSIVFRQGYIQLGAGLLLVAACFPFSNPSAAFLSGGSLSQSMGIVFLVLLVFYIFLSIRWARKSHLETAFPESELCAPESATSEILILFIACLLVVSSSEALIVTATETATRMHVSESVIAATLVAFGTSLPELITALTAVRRRHGELAIGNVIGADILNVFFVAGAAAAVTPAGLEAGVHFFTSLFPAMLFILVVFRVGIHLSGDTLKRSFGFVLVGAYVFVTVASYW